MRRPAFIVAPFCSTPLGPGHPGVPSSPTKASTQIQTAVRTALATGKRRLCVDMLVAALDVRARTYDVDAAEAIFLALITAVQPVLPVERGLLQVVTASASSAQRVRSWVERSELRYVDVTTLGQDALTRIQTPAETPDAPAVAAVLVLSAPNVDRTTLDLRAVLKAAHKRNIPIVVHNHPRKDAVYELLGFGGMIPYEMWHYEPVFVMAPFAMQMQASQEDRGAGPGGRASPAKVPPRFVLMRQYPSRWGLWHFVGSGSNEKGEDTAQEAIDYELCNEFESRPSDETVLESVASTIKGMF